MHAHRGICCQHRAGPAPPSLACRSRRTPDAALRAAFQSKMAACRRAALQENLDTCYDLAGLRHVRLPRIALVLYRNAIVKLDRSRILLGGCLAFTANDDDSTQGILGNAQQKTIEVLHDIGDGNIGFRLRRADSEHCRPY